MCSTSVLTSIIIIVFNFVIILSLVYLCLNFFLKIKQIRVFSYDFCCSFVNGIIFFFSKLIIFIECSLKDSQNLFMQPSPQYLSCSFNYTIKYPYCEYRQDICSPTFVLDNFSKLPLNKSILLMKDSRPA